MNLKALNKKQWQVLIISSLCVIFGILFCIFSESLIDILTTIICAVVLVYGGFYLISYCVVSLDDRNPGTLFRAMIAIIVGTLVIFLPSFFVMAVSFMVFACGLAKLYNVVKVKQSESRIAVKALVIGIIESVVGLALLVLCNTPVPTLLVTIYLGVMLIFEGVLNLVLLIISLKGEKLSFKGPEVLKTEEEQVQVEEQNAEEVKSEE